MLHTIKVTCYDADKFGLAYSNTQERDMYYVHSSTLLKAD
jgi:hypothetical protein